MEGASAARLALCLRVASLLHAPSTTLRSLTRASGGPPPRSASLRGGGSARVRAWIALVFVRRSGEADILSESLNSEFLG